MEMRAPNQGLTDRSDYLVQKDKMLMQNKVKSESVSYYYIMNNRKHWGNILSIFKHSHLFQKIAHIIDKWLKL